MRLPKLCRRPAAVAAALCVCLAARADVVFTGTVDPGDPAEVTPNTEVIIGPAEGADVVFDPRGSVVVDGGSQFEAGAVQVGENLSALARMTVSGDPTTVSIGGDSPAAFPTLGIAQQGSGYLRIEDGAWVAVGSNERSSGIMAVGPANNDANLGIATVEVAGAGTLLTVGYQLTIDGYATSQMSVTDGAVVRVGPASNNGYFTRIDGRLAVEGAQSELQANGLMIGERGDGVLRVGEGAFVRPFGGYAWANYPTVIDDRGRLEMAGGTFMLPLNDVQGTVSGSGTITRPVEIHNGRLEVGEGDALRIDGYVFSNGSVVVDGGQLTVGDQFLNEGGGDVEFSRSNVTVLGTLENQSSMRVVDSHLAVMGSGGLSFRNAGTVELIDSEFEFGQGVFETNNNTTLVMESSRIVARPTNPRDNTGLLNRALFDVRAGHNEILARISGDGALRVGPGASVDFRTAQFQHITLEEDASATFAGSGGVFSTLDISLSGANLTGASLVGEQDLSVYSRVSIDAAGLSDVAAGQSYSLVEAMYLNGQPYEFDLPELPGTLEFVPQMTNTELSLLVIDTALTLPGDYNADGCVDAADYTLIRDGVADFGNHLAFATWRGNYGRLLPGSTAPIPEPTAVVIGLTALALSAASRLRGAA